MLRSPPSTNLAAPGPIGGTTPSTVNSTAVTAASGTITASAPALTVTETWNNAGVAFTGILENITNTNSAAGSLLLDLQVGGVSQFNVDKAGNVTFGATGAVVAAGAYAASSAGLVDLGQATKGLKRLYIDFTNTGTVGPVTINKAAGRVNIAAVGTSVVVTNSLVTAASHVLAVMSSADTTGRVISVVPAAGSFTINTVAVTAQSSFDFFVINAD